MTGSCGLDIVYQWFLCWRGSRGSRFEKFVDVLQIMRLTNFVLIEKGGLTS